MDKKLLSRDSLNEILRSFEVIPDIHRATVWKAILNLPGNKEEYLTLRNAGRKFVTNTDFADIQDENTRKLTCRVVRSVLAHSPSLVTLKDFISNFVGAFSIALASNELVYFEVILTILVNFCQHWFSHSPQPPYSLFSMMDIILMKQEPALYRHMATKGVRCINYAWTWMSKAFRPVTYKEEWLILWDHILSNEPSFICFLPLAVCKIHSQHITQLSRHEEIMAFLQEVPPLDAQSLLQEVYRLDETTCSKFHLSYSMHHFSPLPLGKYPTLNTNDVIKYMSELTNTGNMENLLGKTNDDTDIERVLAEGMTLRKHLASM